MSKLQLATWLATVSWSKGRNTLDGACPTQQSWIDRYMELYNTRELQEEYNSYMC